MGMSIVEIENRAILCHALSTAKFTIHLRDRLRLEAAPEELVESFRTGRELRDRLPAFQDHVAGLEATDVDGLAGRDDDLLGHVRANLGGVCHHRGRGHREPHEVREPGLFELLRGRGSYASQLFNRLDGLDSYCHLVTFLL